MKYKIIQMRGGAPDKIQLYHDKEVQLIHQDFCNLVDYDPEEICKLINDGYYLLPADEGDVRYANKIYDYMLDRHMDQSNILLPQTNINEIPGKKVIDYNKFIPKDGFIYSSLENYTGLKYAKFKSYSIEEFKDMKLDSTRRVAYKTTTGSGSRGVLLIDPDRVHLGFKYRSILTPEDKREFLDFANKENCRIIIQELIPNDPKLRKVNVDFLIKNKKIIGYKWDLTDPTAVFTNWNFGWMFRNKYTDTIMSIIEDHLVNKCGIVNAIMNFEAFSDNESETWLIEFNWRYSNSTFEWQALGIDPIYNYLENIDFNDKMPYGENKFARYWQCKFYKDIEDYRC